MKDLDLLSKYIFHLLLAHNIDQVSWVITALQLILIPSMSPFLSTSFDKM